MTDSYVYVITALLPLSACMLVFQVNPYHALVIRGILGAVAALVYTVLGAADVALTEAMVGTMLAVTLYAVAVRSSLVLRLGVLQEAIAAEKTPSTTALGDRPWAQLLQGLRSALDRHHLRLELVPYLDAQDLQRALREKEIHALCLPCKSSEGLPFDPSQDQPFAYHTVTRLRQIHDILQAGLPPSAPLTYVQPPDIQPSAPGAARESTLGEVQR